MAAYVSPYASATLRCFLKVDMVVAADLDYKIGTTKALTVDEEFAVCVADAPASSQTVSSATQIEIVMSEIDRSIP